MADSVQVFSSEACIHRLEGLHAPLLSDEQVGHIRHVGNLARLPQGDWRHMAGYLPYQEDFSAYRYQIGYMSLAMALAHFHRLPAAPAIFKPILDSLIQRMLEPEVWGYWRDTSTAGGFGPFDLPRLPSRTDPIAVDNIMYSAYLQVMTLMFTMLFGDRKYERPGSLQFRHRPVLWGKDRHEAFEYDQRSLNERVYWNMVENGYLGVACEPFCVFQMCNQVPILGFRLHDHLYGGETAREVTEGYLRAWEGFGSGVNKNGHFATFLVQRNDMMETDYLVDGDSAWTDGWLGMLLNMWRPELVRCTYRAKIDRWLKRHSDGTIGVDGGARIPGSEKLVEPGTLGEIGWLAGWASEMGDSEVVGGLLRYADTYMNPMWDNGGLYYPRHDATFDEDGHFVAMMPTVSNAMFPYARLNVEDGLRKLYTSPWTDLERSQPALVAVGSDIDVRRAWFHRQVPALQVVLSPMRGVAQTRTGVSISGVWAQPADWSLMVDRQLAARGVAGGVASVGGSNTVEVRRVGDLLDLRLLLEGQRSIDIVWDPAP